METHSLQVLEFDRILMQLAGCARLPAVKEAIRQPHFHAQDGAEHCFDQIEALQLLESECGAPPLRELPMVQSLLLRIEPENAYLSPPDTRSCGLWLAFAAEIQHYFRQAADKDLPFAALEPIVDAISVFPAAEKAILNAINERDELNDNASPELKRIRRSLRETSEHINNILRRLINNPDQSDYFQDRVVTIREERFVVPLKANHQGKLPGIIHDRSSSGETLFVEPEAVVALNNQLKTLLLDEEREIIAILKGLADMLRRATPAIIATEQAIMDLDLVNARTQFAAALQAVRPTFGPGIELKAARHPLLRKTPVPVDIAFGPGNSILVVTGPNTGGKTVTLKTAGLFCLMARAGLFIPAAEGSRVGFFREVYCDIGDEQSIEQSLSTFSGHMTNIVHILRHADQNSLVLLDEMGAGTDPEEGAALGIAILETLLERTITALCTTHYGAIKNFAYTTAGIENACMEFDMDSLMPTFHLVRGMPGASRALEIGERLGLPPQVITRAKQRISGASRESGEMLRRIERDLARAREKKKIAEAQARLKEELSSEYRRKLETINEKRREILEQARREAAALLRDREQETDRILHDLRQRESPPSAREISDIKAALHTSHNELGASLLAPDVETHPQPPQSGTAAAGDVVEVLSLGREGTVISVEDGGERLLVALGSFQTMVPVTGVRPTGRRAQRSTFSASVEKPDSFYPVLDIRGCRFQEARDKLRNYLDDAALVGMSTLTIIHGKGTGALGKATAEVLTGHPMVKRFGLAPPERGGAGSTEVELHA